MRPPENKAFTLIECLVVLAVVGLLAGLILPAVSSARESARRLECANQLRQLGDALHTYSATYRSYPSGLPPRLDPSIRFAAGWLDVGFYYDLLPYLEQTSLFNAINIAPDLTVSGRVNASSPQNMTAYSTRLSGLMCPTDSVSYSGQWASAPNSYRLNVGCSDPFTATRRATQPGGAFQPGVTLSDSDFIDGLSDTMAMSERLVGSGSGAAFDRARDFWMTGTLELVGGDPSDSQVIAGCRSLRRTPGRFYDQMGFSWMTGSSSTIWYNHLVPPNDSSADCSLSSWSSASDPDESRFYSVAARSLHPAGVNALLMDGSVRGVSSAVNPATWHALGTRAGGEVVGGSW
jgi:prepilin-type N-terminal cleavage/methylation domain-containing protein